MVDQSTNQSKQGFCRRTAVKALGGLGVASFLSGCGSNVNVLPQLNSGGQERRNVVFLLSDDHRYDFMSFTNEPGTPAFLETPNMDRLANDGVHIANATVSTPLCAPSRASILTGQHAHQHGIINNKHPDVNRVPFFPEHLQEAGYETAFIGKWHTYQADNDSPRPGFDHWVSFEGQETYFDPTFNINGTRVERKGYITDLLTEYARKWLDNRNGDRPFFLYLSHKAPHSRFRPAPRHRGTYADAPIEYPETMANTKENYAGKPEWVKDQREGVRGVNYIFGGQFTFDELYRRYCEMLLALDESIGTIRDYLDESGLAESTLLLYTSDHGYSLGENGLIGKQTAYKTSLRVPFLAYAPGMIEPETVAEERVSNVDIAPTILEEAGHSVPGYMSGQSFLPALSDEDTPTRKETFHESFWGGAPHHPTMFAVYRGRYKYIWYYGPVNNELYDLQSDPLEQHNLVKEGTHENLFREMHDRLFDWIKANKNIPIPLQRSRRESKGKKRPKDEPKTSPDTLT